MFISVKKTQSSGFRLSFAIKPILRPLVQVSGTFLCMDCQAVIKDVSQQFKYSPPTICRNPVCNNRSRFHLDTHKSKFIDFQKVTVIKDVCLSVCMDE